MKKFAAFTPELLFLIIFLCIGYVPRLGAADNIAPQWLALSTINLICGIYFIVNNKYKINDINVTLETVFFLIFIIWASISLSYSVNVNEALIKLTRWLNVLFLLFNLKFIVSYISNWKIVASYIIVLGLFWEVYNSMLGYFEVIGVTNYDFSKTNFLKGVTGNKNITSASIALKIPFLVFLISTSKNKLLKAILFSLLGYSLFNLILLSSRAVYISISLLAVFYTISQIYFSFRHHHQSGHKFRTAINRSFIFLAPLIGVIAFTFLTLGSANTANVVNRIQTINTEDTSTQIRLRFYGHAIDQILENPFLGTGLGNWKLKSLDYDAQEMFGYVVPYHAHNDFLEIGAELGVIGMIVYILFLVIPFFRTLGFILETKNVIDFHFGLALLGALIVYGIDANLNFPHARVIMQIGLMMIIAMSNVLIFKNKEE